MAGWTASAKWAAGPALAGRRAALLGLGLNEGLGHARPKLVSARQTLPAMVGAGRTGVTLTKGASADAPAAATREAGLTLPWRANQQTDLFISGGRGAAVCKRTAVNSPAAAAGEAEVTLPRRADQQT